MMKKFGTVPWTMAYYGEPSPSAIGLYKAKGSSDMERLRGLLELLKEGRFEETKNLAKWMTHPSFDIRRYAQQLYADVCDFEEVRKFEDLLELPDTSSEIYFVMSRLGATFSLSAIPMILECWERYSDSRDSLLDEYVGYALADILSTKVLEGFSLSRPYFEYVVEYGKTFDRNHYYFGGSPLFIGSMTKELVVDAIVCEREKKPFSTGYLGHQVSNLSGIMCPIEIGNMLSEQDVHNVLDYVQKIARMKWTPGVKYFYGHPIR
jgi:hypothetical protein